VADSDEGGARIAFDGSLVAGGRDAAGMDVAGIRSGRMVSYGGVGGTFEGQGTCAGDIGAYTGGRHSRVVDGRCWMGQAEE
jgi:hypothetical protein